MVSIMKLTGGGTVPAVEAGEFRPVVEITGPDTFAASLELRLDYLDMRLFEELHQQQVKAYAHEMERRLLALMGEWKGSDRPCVWVGPDGFPVGLSEEGEPAPSLMLNVREDPDNQKEETKP